MSELSAEVLDIFDDETICKNESNLGDVENDNYFGCHCDCDCFDDDWPP